MWNERTEGTHRKLRNILACTHDPPLRSSPHSPGPCTVGGDCSTGDFFRVLLGTEKMEEIWRLPADMNKYHIIYQVVFFSRISIPSTYHQQLCTINSKVKMLFVFWSQGAAFEKNSGPNLALDIFCQSDGTGSLVHVVQYNITSESLLNHPKYYITILYTPWWNGLFQCLCGEFKMEDAIRTS